MSGQSANLTLAEARTMQERVQASGSHAKSNGGKGKKTKGGSMEHEQHKETAHAHNNCKK